MMKKFVSCFLPLVLPMLLSLVPVGVINFWENWRTDLRIKREREAWQENITGRINEFRAGFSIDQQFRNMFSRLGRTIQESLAENPKMVFDENLFTSAMEKNIPLSHRPEGSKIFGFSLEGSRQPRIFSGRSFSQVKGRLVVRLLDDLVEGYGTSLSEKNTFNRRSRQLFGDLVDYDLLAFQEGGKTIQAVWEGERVILAWSRIVRSEKPVGGFLMVVPENRISQDSFLEYSLRNSLWKGDCTLFPLLMPIEIASGSCSPIILEESGNGAILEMMKTRLESGRSYDEVIPLEIVKEVLSGYWAFRTSVSIDLPYEIWCFGAIPLGSTNAVSLAILAGILWASIWIIAFLQIGFRGKPLKISMRDWFAGFILLVGGIPVSILFVVGSFMIENSSDRRINESIRGAVRLLENVDRESVAELSRFAESSKKIVHSPEFLEMLKIDSHDLKDPKAAGFFKKFREAGIPLESQIIFEFGKRTVFLSEDQELRNRADPVMGFYFPMMMGCLKYMDVNLFNQIEKTLSEKEKGILNAYFTAMDSGMFHNFVSLRQKGFLFDFYHTQLFQFFDFIAINGNLAYGIIFRAKAGEIYPPYVRRHLQAYSQPGAGSLFSFARETSSNVDFEEFPGKGKIPLDLSMKLRDLLMESLSIGVDRTYREGSLVFVTYPCKRMRGIALGSVVDLSRQISEVQKFHSLLKVSTGIIVCILLLVGFGGAGYFLTPLLAVENGFLNLLKGNLEMRLNLKRDDELGDVAIAFDRMMDGLSERNALGKFVSQTLESTLQKSEAIQMEPVLRPGVVLASDIRSFTTLSEKFPPEMIVEMLNRHLDVLSGAIKKHGGMIDKFIGDAIVAVFLDPDPGVSAKNSVLAAREMMASHMQIDRERKALGLFSYGMGIGIDSGEVLVGTFGSEDRYEFTVLGEPRISAEEFEAGSKKGIFSRIIVSGRVAQLCTNYRFHAMAQVNAFELIE